MSSEQCTKIQSQALGTFLAKSDYNRHFPQALVFAPKSQSRVGMAPFYFLRGQQYLRILMRHTLLQRQIQIDSAWVQLEAGTSIPVLEITHAKIYTADVQDGWIMSIGRFLSMANGKVKFFTGTRHRHIDTTMHTS